MMLRGWMRGSRSKRTQPAQAWLLCPRKTTGDRGAHGDHNQF
jgi:hypothetical protein